MLSYCSDVFPGIATPGGLASQRPNPPREPMCGGWFIAFDASRNAILLRMCCTSTICYGTLPATLRLSYECSSVLITDLLRSSRYKAIPHGSTALTDISHRLNTSPTGGNFCVAAVGFTLWALQQLQLYKSTLQIHFVFSCTAAPVRLPPRGLMVFEVAQWCQAD